MNELIRMVFVEQPLASPGSAKNLAVTVHYCDYWEVHYKYVLKTPGGQNIVILDEI